VKQASLDKRPREQMVPTLVGAGVLCLIGWGKVVSVFSQAVNIRHDQGLLVSVVGETRSMTFLSVCLPALFRNQNEGLAPGDRVRFEGHRLVTEDFDVDFPGRPTWQGTLTRDDVKGFRASKVSFVKEALLLKGRDGGFLGLLCGDAAKNSFVDKAVKVLNSIRSVPLGNGGLKGLSDLVGLGPGSTPSGDDFIAGVLLGQETLRLVQSEEAKAVAGSQESMIPWPMENEDLWVAMNGTNDAGKTLLWQALQGHFPEYLIETVRSVSDAEGKQEIVDAVERAVGRGATSGTDALVGFVFCFEGDPHNRSYHPSISKS
jgi:hypothetical protein